MYADPTQSCYMYDAQYFKLLGIETETKDEYPNILVIADLKDGKIEMSESQVKDSLYK